MATLASTTFREPALNSQFQIHRSHHVFSQRYKLSFMAFKHLINVTNSHSWLSNTHSRSFKPLSSCPLHPIYIKKSQMLQKDTKNIQKNRELGDTLPALPGSHTQSLHKPKLPPSEHLHPHNYRSKHICLVKKDLISNSFLNSF